MTYSLRHAPKMALIYLVAIVLVIFQLGPFVWQIITSLKYDRDLESLPPVLPPGVTSIHYHRLFVDPNFLHYMLNSAVVAIGTTLLALAVGSMAAFAIARTPVLLKGPLMGVFLVASMFPQIAVVGPLFKLVHSWNLYNTYGALIFTYMLFALPLSVWLLHGFFRAIPRELDEAAMVDGCSTLRIYWMVDLPLVRTGLVTAGLLIFITAWNEFLLALTFTDTASAQTIPVGIALLPQLFYVPWGDIAAASVVVTLPLAVLVLVFQDYIVGGVTQGAVKG
jgi:ABC-type glycerol-3-phosphate transport system permease component